jgi:hypothetical protein
MKKNFYKALCLKKISSILLLLVFTLGITPKKTLHTWFANHTDSTSKIPESKTPQLSNAGFNCNCDDLVAESHFLTFSTFAVVNLPSVHSFISVFILPFQSLSLFHNNLRGPPFKILVA